MNNWVFRLYEGHGHDDQTKRTMLPLATTDFGVKEDPFARPFDFEAREVLVLRG
jgi:hypothetical protein